MCGDGDRDEDDKQLVIYTLHPYLVPSLLNLFLYFKCLSMHAQAGIR